MLYFCLFTVFIFLMSQIPICFVLMQRVRSIFLLWAIVVTFCQTKVHTVFCIDVAMSYTMYYAENVVGLC